MDTLDTSAEEITRRIYGITVIDFKTEVWGKANARPGGVLKEKLCSCEKEGDIKRMGSEAK